MADASTPKSDSTSDAALESMHVKPVSKPVRSGGPRTKRGKKVSSKNAMRHGILANTPLVGFETQEDWEEHLEGMRAAWKPMGHYEEVLVLRAATNLWKRARVEVWARGIITQQLTLVDLDEIFEGDRSYPPGLSSDSTDANSAIAVLKDLETQPKDHPIATSVAAMILAVAELEIRMRSWPGIPDDLQPSTFDNWTAGQLRECLQRVAHATNASVAEVVESALSDFQHEALLKSLHDQRRESRLVANKYRAMMLSGTEADLEIRYSAHLDREFARILKSFEEAQRARNNDLPPPIRVDVSHQ
jgi:hypothetical protein